MSEKICKKCNKEVDESAKFCPECGAKVIESEPVSQAKSAAPAYPMKEVLTVIGVVALITVSFFIFIKPQPVPQPMGQPLGGAGHDDPSMMGANLPNLPEDYEGLVATGHNFMDQANFPVAAECYRRALDIDGSSADVRSDFGSCLYGMGLPDRAIEEFHKVLEFNPMHSIVIFNLGIVHYSKQTTDSARYYFARFLELEPEGDAAEKARKLLGEMGT